MTKSVAGDGAANRHDDAPLTVTVAVAVAVAH